MCKAINHFQTTAEGIFHQQDARKYPMCAFVVVVEVVHVDIWHLKHAALGSLKVRKRCTAGGTRCALK
jgi:hypothetical protein